MFTSNRVIRELLLNASKDAVPIITARGVAMRSPSKSLQRLDSISRATGLSVSYCAETGEANACHTLVGAIPAQL